MPHQRNSCIPSEAMVTHHSMSDLELLDTAAVAQLLSVTPHTVREWRKKGEGPPWIRLPSGTYRYPRTDLEKWLSQNRQQQAG
jgi:predicted DNA-binding transcriptional regulator AlpA